METECLENAPEYRVSGYFKFIVRGHLYTRQTPVWSRSRSVWVVSPPVVEWPEEEFNNIEDARKCAEKFRKLTKFPDLVEIRAYYDTLCGVTWEHVI